MGSPGMRLSPSPGIRVVVGIRRALDRVGFESLLNSADGLHLAGSSDSLQGVLELCASQACCVAVVEADNVNIGTIDLIHQLTKQHLALGVLVLDDELRLSRATRIMQFEMTSYYSRHSDFETIYVAIEKLYHGIKSFDPQLQNSLSGESNGFGIKLRIDSASVISLTRREFEVMRQIALGKTVKEAAEVLHLASSTVDSHKSRLMRKLGVHRLAHLTTIAIREGVIDCMKY
jgi:DNA-binding NarL/FixJ family response regulator